MSKIGNVAFQIQNKLNRISKIADPLLYIDVMLKGYYSPSKNNSAGIVNLSKSRATKIDNKKWDRRKKG